MLVLVLMLISALIVVPLINYTMAVSRAAQVEVNKARSVQLARGGFWVALSYQEDLYDMCNGGSFPSSLPDVDTTCTVLRTDTLRPIAKVPAHIAVVQADTGGGTPAAVPPAIVTGGSYLNPNTPADESTWLATPDWTTASEATKVWLPELPVQSTSGGGTRDTTMLPGTQDPLYASCRVFFPGTFSTPITIAEPAYFASGVYYFTEPITLENGADVVVGNGADGGCTTDFEAVASATTRARSAQHERTRRHVRVRRQRPTRRRRHGRRRRHPIRHEPALRQHRGGERDRILERVDHLRQRQPRPVRRRPTRPTCSAST